MCLTVAEFKVPSSLRVADRPPPRWSACGAREISNLHHLLSVFGSEIQPRHRNVSPQT